MIVRAGAVVFGLVAAMVGVAVGSPASAAQTVEVLVPLAPARILDTRSALGADGPVGPDSSISVDVTGVGGVPDSGVGAVVLNVTAAEATADTWLTVFPHGQTMPETSNLNVTEGFVRANTVVATVGDGGLVDLYNFAGSVDLIADVMAWLPSGGGYTGFVPQRVLDTRVGGQPVGPNGSIDVQLAGRAGVPASGVGAVVLSVTSTQATADTFLTVWPSDQVRADSSNLNPLAGRDASNAVVAGLSADGRISVFNSAGSTHVIVDVFGWLPIGVGFTGLNPARILDTRSGVGLASPVGAAGTLSLDVTGVGGVPPTGVGAVVLNLTATQASEATFVTAWPSGLPRPTASSLNPAPGGVSVANLVVAAVGGDGNVSLYNDVGNIHLIADVVGWFAESAAAATNQSPVAVDDAATTDEDNAVTVGVLANDTDPDGDALAVTAVGAPSAGGSALITGSGSAVSFDPGSDFDDLAAGESRPTLFTYTVSDGTTADSATVTVTVTGVADDPTAVADAATVAEGAAASAIDVLANDTDPDGGPKTIQAAGDPANGTVAITGGGTGVTYQPDLGYCNDPPGTSPDTFTYTLDGGSTATVTVTVSCFDDAPTAVDDAATVTEDSGATAIDVFANDTDPDAGPKTVISTTDPANGTVVITGGGTGLTYQPDLDYCNAPPGTTPGTFTYTLNGGSIATVSVTVTCVPDDPAAVNDAATVVEDSPATAIDVLANDTDPDGGPNTVTSTTDPANGTVTITGGGTGLTYQPDANYCNDPPGTTPDTFTYTLNGGSVATVSVTVTCVPDDPTAVNDAATVAEDSGANTIDVLANDTDPDTGPNTVSSTTDPANGTVVITGGGTELTYQPDANYCNDPPGTTPDTFTYTLNGGSVGTVAVTVTCVDDPPTAVDDTATVPEDSGATPVHVLANDTDTDAGPKTVISTTDPANGTVAITGGGTGLTYQPDLDYCNSPPGTTPDTFAYTLNGGSTATVSVTVTCGDDAPVAVADAATVIEDATATAIDVLANDTDIDGGPMTIAAASDPTNGTVVLTGGGPGAHTGLTYQPDLNYCNDPPGTTPDTFTYTLNGGSIATVSVTVTCVPDPATLVNSAGPLAYTENDPATAVDAAVAITNPDAVTITDGSVSITTNFQSGQDVLDWVDNNPGDGITEGVSTAQTVVLTGSGTATEYAAALAAVTYVNTSENPSTVTRTVTFAITAGVAASDTIDITVASVDDPPVAVNDAATVLEDAAATAVTVLTNDTDVDGGTKAIASVTQPTNGTVVITGGGTGLTYQPNSNYCNNPPGTSPDTFTYTLNGGSTATVSVTVTCVNDPPVAADLIFNGANAAIGNTALVINDPTDAAPDPTGVEKTVAGDVLAGGTDVDTPSSLWTLTVTTVTNAGGSLVIEADGDVTYHPAAGFSGDAVFTYTLNDNDPDTPANQTDTGTITINVPATPRVWYVDNTAAAGGDGTSDGPFDALADVTGATGPDAAGDIIYLHSGTGAYTGGVTLLNTQTLHGAGTALVVSGTTLAAAGADPTIANATGNGVTLASGNTLTGFTVADTTGFDIANTPTATVGALTISNVVLNGTGGLFRADSGGALTVTFDSASTTAAGASGIVIAGGATGSLTVTGATTINDATADGIAISNSAASATFTGLVTIINDAGGANGDGVDLSTNTGTYSFNGGVNVTVNGAGAFGFRAQSSGTVNIPDPNGTNQITSNNGTALLINPTTLNATLASVTSSGGTDGISLNGMSGSLTIGSVDLDGQTGDGIDITNSPGTVTINGGTIGATNDPAGIGVDISGGAANVTINATVTKTTAGDLIEISGRTGGTVDFNSNLTSTNGGGIDLTGNTGATIRFDGGMNLSTGAAAAFNATGGGTVAVTDTNGPVTVPNNTLTTTTGTALNIQNTTIHSDGLTFQSISATGGANGIVVNNTGNSGGLTVTGTGGAASGGTVQSITNRGASFINAVNVSLTGMNFTNANTTDGATSDGVIGGNTDENAALYLQGVTQVDLVNLVIDGAAQHGINGNNVTDLDISGTTIQNAGDEVWESSIYIHDLKGVASAGRTSVFNNLNITNDSGQFNIFLQNNDGTNDRPAEKDRLEITNSQFTRNGNNFLISDNVSVFNSGTGNFQVVVSGSTFTATATCGAPLFAGACVSDNIQVDAGNTAAFDAVITTANNFTAGNAGQAAVNISASGGGQGTFNVQNVTSTVRASTGINVALTTTNPAASLRGTIANNILATSVSNNPAAGINMVLEGAGTMVVDVNNNTISGADPTGFDYGIRGGARAGSGTADFQVNNNTAFGEAAGVWFFAGNAMAGETSRTCVNFIGNNIDGGVTSFADYFVEMYINTVFQLQGFAGAGTNAAQVAAFIASRDDDAGSVVDAGSGTIVNYSSAVCSTP